MGLKPEKIKLCTFPAKKRARKMGCRGVVFCDVYDAPLLPLSLDRFPQNFPRTCVQVVARDIWFHIPEKFPLRGRICRKTFLGYPICDQATGHGKRSATPTVTVSIPWWTSHRCALPIVTFAEGCTVFQLSTSERLTVPRYQQRRNVDA